MQGGGVAGGRKSQAEPRWSARAAQQTQHSHEPTRLLDMPALGPNTSMPAYVSGWVVSHKLQAATFLADPLDICCCT